MGFSLLWLNIIGGQVSLVGFSDILIGSYINL